MKKKTIISVDLEYDWGSKKTSNLVEIVPRLLDFFDVHEIKATFFVLGDLADRFEGLIKDISKKHEIGSHGFSHRILNRISKKEVEYEVARSKKVLEDLGIRVYGFRSPECIFPVYLGKLLKKNGYVYDSSISRFIFPGRYSRVFVSTKPYIADAGNITKKGRDILELPIPNFSILSLPFGFPWIRLFYPLSLWRLKMRYMFYMHPCEFLGKSVGKGENPLIRFFYGRNRGRKAWDIFENFINKLDADFITCSDYIKIRFPNLL